MNQLWYIDLCPTNLSPYKNILMNRLVEFYPNFVRLSHVLFKLFAHQSPKFIIDPLYFMKSHICFATNQ